MVAVVAILFMLDVLFLLLGWLSLYGGSGLTPPAATWSAFYVRDLFFFALAFGTLAVTALHVHNLLLLLGFAFHWLGFFEFLDVDGLDFFCFRFG